MLANRLTQITLKFFSLVPAGANRREFVAKADGGPTPLPIEVKLLKVNEELRQVTGAIYPPGQVDTQGDFITEADFDAAMHDFMAKGRTAAGIACDRDHDEAPTTDYIVEAYKLAVGDSRWPGEVEGSWIITRQVTDDATWAKVLDGTYKAFSFGGTAVRIPNQPVTKTDDPAALRRFAEALKKGLLADRMARMEVPHLLDAACQAMWDAYYGAPADTAEERAAVAAVVAELTAELSKESNMDKSVLKRLQDGIAALFAKAVEEPETVVVETPELAPAAKSVEETVAEAVEAAKAEQEAALEALKADFAAQLHAKDDEIERLGKLAPSSERLGHNGKGDDEVSGGGVFAGRVQ